MHFYFIVDEPKAYEIPKEGLSIMLDIKNQEGNRKKPSKEIDYEACMKRKLNRIIKEHQVILHKVNLICWVSHGNYVNPIINNRRLMADCLKLLPENKNHCYPKEKTDVDYFKQITHWFKSTVVLKKNFQNMYCKMRIRPPLMTSLALQIRTKSAICRRDYVLIFICLLRAIGIQCRMVQSFVTAPLRPAKSDLLVVSSKAPDDKNKPKPRSKSNSNKTKSKTVKKPKDSVSSEESSMEEEVVKKKSPTKTVPRSSRLRKKAGVSENIPQMDGADDNGKKKPTSTKKKSTTGVNDFLTVLPSPRRLRSRSKSGESTENMVKPVVNLSSKSDIPSTSKSTSKSSKPATTNSPKPSSSEDKKNNVVKFAQNPESSEDLKKDENKLDIFSPRRTRTSRLNKEEVRPITSKELAKPNLKSLLNIANTRKRTTEVKNVEITKKLKVVTAAATTSVRSSKKRSSLNANVNDIKSPKSTKKEIPDENSSDSLNFFKPKETDLKVKRPVKSEKTPTPKIKVAPAINRMKVLDKRVLSTDDEEVVEAVKDQKGIDIWVEVFSEDDDKWLTIDVYREKVDCLIEIQQKATHPMIYVFAWNNDNSVKDVSARYIPNLNTTVRKMRVETEYLEKTLKPFIGVKTPRDRQEDNDLNILQLAVPMPTTVSG